MKARRVVDLDARRPDRELQLITFTTIAGTFACFLLYLASDTFRGTGRNASLGQWLPWAVLSAAAAVYCARAVRYVAAGRVLKLDPSARRYVLSRGCFRTVPLGSGGYGDFAAVRLQRQVRRVYGQRYVRDREFWTVLLDWKGGAERPICLEEVAGAVVDPRPWLALDQRGAHHRAQAALHRWAEELGVPALDPTAE